MQGPCSVESRAEAESPQATLPSPHQSEWGRVRQLSEWHQDTPLLALWDPLSRGIATFSLCSLFWGKFMSLSRNRPGWPAGGDEGAQALWGESAYVGFH